MKWHSKRIKHKYKYRSNCHESRHSQRNVSRFKSTHRPWSMAINDCRKDTAPLRAATPSLRRICAVGPKRRGVDEGRRSPSTFWGAAREWSGARTRTGRALSWVQRRAIVTGRGGNRRAREARTRTTGSGTRRCPCSNRRSSRRSSSSSSNKSAGAHRRRIGAWIKGRMGGMCPPRTIPAAATTTTCTITIIITCIAREWMQGTGGRGRVRGGRPLVTFLPGEGVTR